MKYYPHRDAHPRRHGYRIPGEPHLFSLEGAQRRADELLNEDPDRETVSIQVVESFEVVVR